MIIIFISKKPFIGRETLTRRELINKSKKNSVKLFHYQPEFQGIENILYYFYFFCKYLIYELWLNAYIFTDFNGGKIR